MPKKPEAKRTMIFCEICGHKQILEPNVDAGLIEIKTSPVPGAIPQLDPATGKTVTKPEFPQTKKYKCPRCGRGVRIRDLLPPFAKAMKELDEQKEKERIEQDKQKRLEDGKPLEKKVDPQFLG